MNGKLLDRLRFARDHRWSPRHMSEYLDGELHRDGEQRIERHTGVCPRCHELLEALRTMVAALGGMRGDRAGAPADAGPAVVAGVRRRLEADEDDERPL